MHPHTFRIGTRSAGAMALTAALATAAALAASAPAHAAESTLAPASLTTTAGSIGSGQSVTALAARDQSGSDDDWNSYVEFIGAYSGYRTYQLSASADADDVTAIELETNYRGPSSDEQRWTWSLYDWATSSWTNVGDNDDAESWDDWALLSFASPADAGDHVSASGEIRVRLTASNDDDAADIDSEALIVTTDDGGSTPPAPGAVTLPPANEGWSYQIGGGYDPEDAGEDVAVISRDRTDAPEPGYYNICYVNVFQTQPNAYDQNGDPIPGTLEWYENNHSGLLLRDSSGEYVVDGGWDEVLIDVRTAAKRAELLAAQQSWFDGCAAAGFDAIEPDNLDISLRSEGLVTFAQSREYMELVVPYVHGIGLAIAQKNTIDQGDGYGGIGDSFVDSVTPAQGFDFAIAEECGEWDECGDYADLYGDLVFQVEYIDNPAGLAAFTASCTADGDERSIIIRDLFVKPFGHADYYYDQC